MGIASGIQKSGTIAPFKFMAQRKPFSKQAYARNDASGKKAVLRFLKNQGLEAWENPDLYGIDLIVNGTSHAGKVFDNMQIEVERRAIWNGDTFPYDTVHIPERKTKFLKKGPMLYAVVNKFYNKVIFCPDSIIRQYSPMEVPNKAVSHNEFFYNVPIRYWTLYDIPTR